MSAFNLNEYAKLLVAMPSLRRSCRASYTFINQHKCHGLTKLGKQCSLNPKYMLHGGLQLCGNHFNQANKGIMRSVHIDMTLMCAQEHASTEAPSEQSFELQPDVYKHFEEYGEVARQLVPWNDAIKQMAQEYHKFSMKCKESMPPHMFACDEALGSIGCDVKVALQFLIFLRWQCSLC